MRALIIFFLSFQAQAAGTAGASQAAGTANMSCDNPSGKMAETCALLRDSLKDPCNKQEVDDLRKQAMTQGPLKGSEQFCPNEASVCRNPDSFDHAVLNFFAGVAYHESGGDPDPKPVQGATKGQLTHGICQIDAQSTGSYKCCKGRYTKDNENDPKAAALCGVGLNLENMIKGKCWAEGGGSDAGSCGAAKYQQVLRDHSAADAKKKDETAAVTAKTCQADTPIPNAPPFNANSGSGK